MITWSYSVDDLININTSGMGTFGEKIQTVCDAMVTWWNRKIAVSTLNPKIYEERDDWLWHGPKNLAEQAEKKDIQKRHSLVMLG